MTVSDKIGSDTTSPLESNRALKCVFSTVASWSASSTFRGQMYSVFSVKALRAFPSGEKRISWTLPGQEKAGVVG